MRLALIKSGSAIGLMLLTGAACSRTHERDVQSRPYVPTAAEQRRIDEKREEQRLAEERKEDDRRAEARRAEDRREEDRRAEERRAEERRADERAKRREEASAAGPNDHVLRPGPNWASESIAAARCDREVKCNRVGAHGKYPSHGACVAEFKRDLRSDLHGDVCADGVREKELNDCLQAIRAEQCGNALEIDAVIRLKACRVENLCVK